MVVIKICERCKKEFKHSPSHKRKFCSLYCSNHGVRKNTGRTHFKNGSIPWNKDKILVEETNYRRPNRYRKILVKNSICENCNKVKEKLLVHHKDKNIHNNQPNNLMIMCYSCHNTFHEVGNKNKYWGINAHLNNQEVKKMTKTNKNVC